MGRGLVRMHRTETRAPLASMERLRNWCGYLRAAPLCWSAWLDSAPRTPTGARWLGTRLPETSKRKRPKTQDFWGFSRYVAEILPV